MNELKLSDPRDAGFVIDYKKGDTVPKSVAFSDSDEIELTFALDCTYYSPVITSDWKVWLMIDGFKYNPEKHGKIININTNSKTPKSEILKIGTLTLDADIFNGCMDDFIKE